MKRSNIHGRRPAPVPSLGLDASGKRGVEIRPFVGPLIHPSGWVTYRA